MDAAEEELIESLLELAQLVDTSFGHRAVTGAHATSPVIKLYSTFTALLTAVLSSTPNQSAMHHVAMLAQKKTLGLLSTLKCKTRPAAATSVRTSDQERPAQCPLASPTSLQ